MSKEHMKASAVEGVAAGRQQPVIGREGGKHWALFNSNEKPVISPEAKQRAKTALKQILQLKEVMERRTQRAR